MPDQEHCQVQEEILPGSPGSIDQESLGPKQLKRRLTLTPKRYALILDRKAGCACPGHGLLAAENTFEREGPVPERIPTKAKNGGP